MVLCAVLSDADDFVEISNWGRLRLGFLRRFRPYAQGVPSHDTLNDVYNALDGDQFQACFIAWVEGLCEAEGEIIAIDGKTSRRTGDRRRGRDPLHPGVGVGERATPRARPAGGGRAVQRDHGDPGAARELAIRGALVTIDAIGCQRAIAEQITDAGGDYLLALKTNQPALHGDVRFFFDDAHERRQLDYHQTVDGDHGRIELRRHWVATDVAWLNDAHGWPASRRRRHGRGGARG